MGYGRRFTWRDTHYCTPRITLDPERIRREIETRNQYGPHPSKKDPTKITILEAAWSTHHRIEIQMLDTVPQEGKLKCIGGLKRASILVYGVTVAEVDLDTGAYEVGSDRLYYTHCGIGAHILPRARFGYMTASYWMRGTYAVKSLATGDIYETTRDTAYTVRDGIVSGLPLVRDATPSKAQQAEARAFAKRVLEAWAKVQPYLIDHEKHPVWGRNALVLPPRSQVVDILEQCLDRGETVSPKFVAAVAEASGRGAWSLYYSDDSIRRSLLRGVTLAYVAARFSWEMS